MHDFVWKNIYNSKEGLLHGKNNEKTRYIYFFHNTLPFFLCFIYPICIQNYSVVSFMQIFKVDFVPVEAQKYEAVFVS